MNNHLVKTSEGTLCRTCKLIFVATHQEGHLLREKQVAPEKGVKSNVRFRMFQKDSTENVHETI